jgi:HipA-like protein
MSDLPVYYAVRKVGTIAVAEDGPLFTYDPAWQGAADAFPVSLRMPLSAATAPPEIVVPWLMNLLPEGAALSAAGTGGATQGTRRASKYRVAGRRRSAGLRIPSPSTSGSSRRRRMSSRPGGDIDPCQQSGNGGVCPFRAASRRGHSLFGTWRCWSARSAHSTNLQGGATADALRAICDLDLTELQAIDPPRGFGRD